MAVSLFTRSLGSVNANLTVQIRNATSQIPAVIYNSGFMVVNTQGLVTLDSSGNLSTYVDTAFTWTVSVISDVKAENDEGAVLSPAQKAAGAVSLYGVTADGTMVAPDGSIVFGNAIKSLMSGSLNRSTAARFRAYGSASKLTGLYTAHLSFQAPAHYDGVRIVLHGAQSSGTNAFKVTVGAPASMSSNYVPKDSAGSDLTMTAVTWGSTNIDDFYSVGGSATTLIQNASGSGATLQEGDVVSDYISLRSLDRTDVAGAAPLFCLRAFGTDMPASSISQMDYADANPYRNVIPYWYSGYWSTTDYTSVANPGSTPGQQWTPQLSVIFYLRGRAAVSLAVCGDSVEAGWVATNVVPQFGANINGWARKLVGLLNTNGIPASLDNCAVPGGKSFPFHMRAINALRSGGLSHLFFKPWSTNENGDGATAVSAALERSAQILAYAKVRGVIPTVIRPWAGQSMGTTDGAKVQAWCDQAAANGVRVFDARAIVDPTGSGFIQSAYLTRDSGGAIVDTTHLNEAGHDAVAAYAYAQRASWLV